MNPTHCDHDPKWIDSGDEGTSYCLMCRCLAAEQLLISHRAQLLTRAEMLEKEAASFEKYRVSDNGPWTAFILEEQALANLLRIIADAWENGQTIDEWTRIVYTRSLDDGRGPQEGPK